MSTVIIDQVVLSIANLLLRGAALLTLFTCSAPLLRRTSSAGRAAAWRLAFVGLTALPFLYLLGPRWAIHLPAVGPAVRPSSRTAVETAEIGRQRAMPGAAAESAPPASPAPRVGAVSGSRAPVAAGPPAHRMHWPGLPALLVTAWLAGALLAAIRPIAGQVLLWRLVRRSTPATTEMAAALAEAAVALRVRRPVKLRLAERAAGAPSPMTWGAVRPAILLPAEARLWSEERLRVVLLHEIALIARFDWPLKLLTELCCILHWPSPLVWYGATRLRRETEMACDDCVLSAGAAAPDYAAVLVEMVRQCRRSAMPVSAIEMADASLLETRVQHALDSRRTRAPWRLSRRLLAGCLCFACMLFLAAARPAALANLAPAVSVPGSMLSRSEAAAPIASDLASMSVAVLQRSTPRALSPRTTARTDPPGASPIAWGRTSHGLQIGIERQDPEPGIGAIQRIGFRLWVRNRGRRPVDTPYFVSLSLEQASRSTSDTGATARPFFWSAVVADNRKCSVMPQDGSIDQYRLRHMTLRAGEERLLPMPEAVFDVREPGNSAVTVPTLFTTGKALLFTVYPFAVAAVGPRWLQTLATGALTVEVKKAPLAGTIARGDAASPVIDGPGFPAGVRWGRGVDGLQAGLRMDGAGDRFTSGARVPLTAFLRNTTDHVIALSYTARVFSGEAPTVRDTANPDRKVVLTSPVLSGLESALAIILGPRETVLFSHPGFVLGELAPGTPASDRVPRGLESYPAMNSPSPGSYTVEQRFVYHLRTPEEVNNMAAASHEKGAMLEPLPVTLMTPDGASRQGEATTIPYYAERSEVTSGAVPFRILEKDGAAERAVDRAASPVSWGESVDGLQAGLRAPAGRTTFPIGSTVHMEYLIRNVSRRPVRFEHYIFSGVAGVVPEVVFRNGRPAHTYGLPLGATSERKSETLPPGESVMLGTTAMGLAGDGAAWYKSRPGRTTIRPTGEKTYTYMDAAPGRYRIRTLYTVTSSDFKEIVLRTGFLPLEVTAPAH